MDLTNARRRIANGFNKAVDSLVGMLRQIPLIGGLVDCTFKDHRSAAREFFLAFVFSSTTFWVTVVIMSVLADYSDTGIVDLTLKTVSNGELLIFSVSFAGPIFIAAMQDRSGKSPFPGAIWHVFALWAFAIVAAIVFGLLKVQVLVPNVNLRLDMGVVREGSYYIFGLALLLRYTTMVYQKMLAAADASGPKQDKDFADQWQAHAESKGQ